MKYKIIERSSKGLQKDPTKFQKIQKNHGDGLVSRAPVGRHNVVLKCEFMPSPTDLSLYVTLLLKLALFALRWEMNVYAYITTMNAIILCIKNLDFQN